jgi:hypothetical protein
MSTERDIERILDAWLATGPTEMPDRAFHDALDRIERVPQRRVAWPTRFSTMFSISRLPVAAAVAALALGLATITLWQGPPDATQAPAASAAPSSGVASPSPTATPSARPSGAVPAALEGFWTAGPRSVPGLELLDTIAQWRISDGLFNASFPGTQFLGSTLGSQVTAEGPDTFRLENRMGGQGCPAESVGTYRWTLSEHATGIVLESLGDDCAERAAYLEGPWSRTSCELGWSCAGPLAPGSYQSAIFDPRAGSEPRVARPGAVGYTVPAGWANADDWYHSLMLVPDSGFQRLLVDDSAWPDQVRIWATPPVALKLEGPDCEWREDPQGGGTVESLAAWLSSHPDLSAGPPTPITIDGHDGSMIDIDLAIDDSTACPAPFDGMPGVPLFGSGSDVRSDGLLITNWEQGGWDFGAGGLCKDCTSDPQRIILLDLDGQPLVILIDSEKPEDQATFVEKAMPIVESLRFPE